MKLFGKVGYKKSLSSPSPCIRYCDDYCGAEKMAVDANLPGQASGMAGLAGDVPLQLPLPLLPLLAG